MAEENQQELLFKFGIYERQIRELQQQIEAVERGILELNSLNFGLDELVGKTGEEIYAPMGKGIFVKAKLVSEELNVDIGEGKIVKKNISETKKLVESQIEKLQQVKEDLEKSLEQLGEEITEIMNSSEHSCGCDEHGQCNCGHDEKCKCEKEEED